ncbi:Ankyrin repeat [Macleaya cordata]|uniref:Ankyrin repeat n=1 Tax=Macleaya cordata TaxID=56857 RepID=A0A200RCA6_MACCD|nr:Ankyrin repeat [Macleaya cordata]
MIIIRDLNEYLPLRKAAAEGDWGSAKKFFEAHPDAKTATITRYSETALHVAAAATHSKFSEELVKLLPPEALELRNDDGETPLHCAALGGIVEAAKVMVNKNPKLRQIRNKWGSIPLLSAAGYTSQSTSSVQKEMMAYLCSLVTKDDDPTPYSGTEGARLICTVIAAGFYDNALSLIELFPNLATEKEESNRCALEVMAERSSAFLSGSSQLIRSSSWLQRCIIYSLMICVNLFPIYISVPGIKQLHDQKLMHTQALALLKRICAQVSLMSNSEIFEYFKNSNVLSEAARAGTFEVVVECFQICPDLFWLTMDGHKSILEIAVRQRREKIFNLMCGMNVHTKKLALRRDAQNNTILHWVAMLAPSPQLNSVSGAALQMQRELQWFKEVENITRCVETQARNNANKTGRVVFTEQHKDLVEKGEKWMKDTANSCMLVATLIATVVFAAAFTVPGGNISDSNSSNNGIPIFLNKNSFMVFAVADALALFSSITSVLMFLSILTSRYAEEDFLKSLPEKLIIGLATLFFSIATMIVAFSAGLSIVLGKRLTWVAVPIGLIACVPVTLFALLQFPLFVEMVRSTYWLNIFHR